MPWWEYLPATPGQNWFPAPEWAEIPPREYLPTTPGMSWFAEPESGRTLRLPYWLLGSAYLGAWMLVMRWRLQRRDKSIGLTGC